MRSTDFTDLRRFLFLKKSGIWIVITLALGMNFAILLDYYKARPNP